MKILQGLLELCYPSRLYCILCGSVIDASRPYGLCDRCASKIHWTGTKTCGICGKILSEGSTRALCGDCRRRERTFSRGYTCTRYGLYERTLITAFKYRDKPHVGRELGLAMADRMALADYRPDLVTPVPVHPGRLAKRGYNQAELMAKAYCKAAGLPLECGLLERLRDTRAMKNLGAAERRENLEGAFGLVRGREELVRGRSVLLLDDILTTGSTADACAAVLLAAGAREVRVLSFSAGADAVPYQRLQ
jgi:ComF family protein